MTKGMLEKKIGDARAEMDKTIVALADEYRRRTLIPICKRLKVTYTSGKMGRPVFYTIGDSSYPIGILDKKHILETTGEWNKYGPLCKCLDVLNTEVHKNLEFGLYVEEITVKDLEKFR